MESIYRLMSSILTFQSGDYWTLLSVQKCERFTFTLLHLIHGALARGFVGTPAKKSRAVSKAPTGEMVVGNLNDYFRSDRFPLAGAVRTPAARSSRRVAVNPGAFFSASNFFVNSRRSDLVKEEVNPTWWSKPSSP